MQKQAAELLMEARRVHQQLYDKLQDTIKDAGKLSLEELADLCYCVKKSHELVDDARKQFSKTEQALTYAVCKKWTTQTAGDSDIVTPYVTAKPKLKLTTTLPSKRTDPDNYNLLMDAFNVPYGNREVFEFHWPTMCEHLTSLAEKGLPFPAGIDPRKVVPSYSVRFYARKDVNGNEQQQRELFPEVIDESENPF